MNTSKSTGQEQWQFSGGYRRRSDAMQNFIIIIAMIIIFIIQ